ncbi:MAG: hypothetical protein A3G58_00295 [Candidatus Colwellbacteria bacterium RIFCSPLOWO2_12_FULL_46_17]|uniref:Glutamyl-tRNA amidotransferase n=1 Tax=Candidatus Colwellbacteria bacterium RIFCSPLOWO2_12_FULL_46_17 TaxID=1797695 RepID=A0A1G1ZCS6_9BACT|nr:MAG: hypothetical protein A3G58_00295 [Candidatus Colwellbacteria bacterium RIFCSPLOWO2_12_FULL_46_17]
MSLIDDFRSGITEALKTKDARRAETLRGLLASAHNEEIAKRSRGNAGELSDEEVIAVLQKEAKKRREAIEIYGKAGRHDLEGKEKEELAIIESYLPPALGDSEIEEIVRKAISSGAEDFGKVMGAVMKEVAGRADSRVVTEIVKKNLGGGE